MTRLELTPSQKKRIVRVLELNNLYYTDEFTHLLIFRDAVYLINADTKQYGFHDAKMITTLMRQLSFDD
jgi:hypothetical protein